MSCDCAPLVNPVLINQLQQKPKVWNRLKNMVVRMNKIASKTKSIDDLNNNEQFCNLSNNFIAIINKNSDGINTKNIPVIHLIAASLLIHVFITIKTPIK